MVRDKDVAIVGMACVFPKANSLTEYWSNLANGVDAIDSLPPGRWSQHNNFRLSPKHEAFIPASRGGYLRDGFLFDPVPFGVLPNLVRHGDPDQFLMLHCIDEALRDAGVRADDPVRERTDLIIGRGGYATGKLVELTLRAEMFETVIELIDRKFPELTANGRRAEIEAYLRSCLTPRAIDNVSTAVSNISASRAANRLDLRGAAYIVDGACASSLLAAEQAVWRLRNRQCDLAVAAGLFLSKSPTFLYVFTQLGALSPGQQIRPFDRRADGLLAGEGGGAVVLKRLEDAYRDGDAIYAIIKGVGTASDGKGVDVLAPFGPGQVRALERAYADADVDRDTVTLLEAHGTGTIAGDQVEIESIKRFFGRTSRPATARCMGTVKSMIGHTMPAAGMAALIKTALALSNKVLPPSLHCDEPREELADCPFYVITRTRPWIHNPAIGPRRAGVNAFGFGGINAHVVLEEARVPTRSRSPARVPMPERGFSTRAIVPGVQRPSELFVLSASSTAELERALARLDYFLDHDSSGATIADIAWTLGRTLDLQKPVKLALIAPSAEELRDRIKTCRERLARSVDPDFDDIEEVYFSANAARHEGRVAFIFPGMGFPGLIGNYPDHLMELCLHYPDVRDEFDFFEDRDRHPEDDIPTSSIFSPPPLLPEEYRKKLKGRLAPPKVDDDLSRETAPRERYLAAMGVTLANWIGWVLLRKFEIPVDMCTGQSQGEMAALCAAGVSDFHATAPSYWKTVNIETRLASGSRLAFAWCSAEKIEPLIAENPGTYLAIYMAPEGLIFGGDRDGLVRIADRLREEQILVQLLPYPPIHTPCLSHLRDELTANLSDEDFKVSKPAIDIYSSITTEKYPDDFHGIRETLLLNVDHPLRIWQTIRRMYEDGARVFVQVGGGHMAAHLEMLLPAGSRVVTAALDVDTRDPITQLNHLCATLLVAGVPLTLQPLHEGRSARDLDLDRPGPAPAPSRMAIPLRIDWTPLYSPNAPPPREPAPVTPATAESASPESAPVPAAPPVPTSTPEEGDRYLGIDPAVAARLPILGPLGRVTRLVPEAELVVERRLDLAEDRYLADHLFVYAETKPLEERLPVLPLTVSMEFVAEAASLLAPGLGLIGYEDIRGRRWIGLRDSATADIRIEARLKSIDPQSGVRRFECGIYFEDKLSFTATVLCGSAYETELLSLPMADSSSDGPWPWTPAQVYEERLMFHGPAFHVVADLYTLGNPGSSIGLWVRPKHEMFASIPDPILMTDPLLMDGIGQAVGLWTWVFDQYILPTGTDKLEFYRPTPPVGTVVPIRTDVLEFNNETKQIRCNIEIGDGAGNVWVRVAGWSEWIMNWPKNYADCTRLPNRYLLTQPLALPGLPEDALCSLVTKQDFQGVDMDWAARIFLHSSETRAYFGLGNTKRKREMVLSRAAAKDAARLWWARRHGGALPHPADMIIGHSQTGAPYLEPEGDPAWPRVSVAHSDQAAIALVSDAAVGIDMEPAGGQTREILARFATASEIALVENLSLRFPGAEWETRLWCAKEALGKALGTGLEGRPKQFEALDGDGDGCFLMHRSDSEERFIVHTLCHDRWIIAYTVVGTEVATDANCATKWQLLPAERP